MFAHPLRPRRLRPVPPATPDRRFQWVVKTLAGAALLIGAMSAADPAAAQNETPKKNQVVFFSPYADDLQGDHRREHVKTVAVAEGYDFVEHSDAAGTVATFVNLAKNRAYAFLTIHTHGSPEGIVLEKFRGSTDKAENEAARDAALAKYQRQFKDLANMLGPADDGVNEPPHSVVIWINAAGLKKLFGTDPNNTIFLAFVCYSDELQRHPQTAPTFKNREVFVFEGICYSDASQSAAYRLLRRLSGGENKPGMNSRPVQQAWSGGALKEYNLKGGRIRHHGGGQTTLSPSVIDWQPRETCGPAIVIVTFDTKMDQGEKDIAEFEDNKCMAQWVAPQGQWSGGGTIWMRSILTGTSQSFIVKVRPSDAVSAAEPQKRRQLIGNLYEADASSHFSQPWVYPHGIAKPDDPWGLNGWAGVQDDYAKPQENPFRWRIPCVCNRTVPDVNEREIEPDQDMSGTIGPQDETAGETLAFVLTDSTAPGPVIMSVLNPPANFTFSQEGDQFAHVIFRPSVAQTGQSYVVTFESADGGGPRYSRDVTFNVLPRVEALAWRNTIANPVIEPGGDGGYGLAITNTGNTTMQNIQFSATAFDGPGTIPPEAVTFAPATIEWLDAGETVYVDATVQAAAPDPVGVYAGDLLFHADTKVGVFDDSLPVTFRLNHAPALSGPGGVIQAAVGDALSIPLTGNDPDGDALTYFMDLPPHGGTVAGGGNNAVFNWQLDAKQVGRRFIGVFVSDAFGSGSHVLEFDIDGPIRLSAAPLVTVYNPNVALPLQVDYLNYNDETATLRETVEAFAGDFNGPLLYTSGETVVGDLAELQEWTTLPLIPPLAGSPVAVRVTSRAIVNGNEYADVSEFIVYDTRADLNCDGVLDFFDLDVFILALLDPALYAAQFPDCDSAAGDINGDGALDFFDIDLFVECLVMGGCL